MTDSIAVSARSTATRIGKALILHGIDVRIAAGRWTAIVGPHGAGTSTLLLVLAGLPPAGVLCELMNPDGSMARGAQVARFARAHGLLCTTVRALADYRRARQP